MDHFLVQMWDTILIDLEEPGSASNVISLDFEKVFNRLDHSACVAALRKKNASPEVLYLCCVWLPVGQTNAGSVRLGDTLSCPRPVNGEESPGEHFGKYPLHLSIFNLRTILKVSLSSPSLQIS